MSYSIVHFHADGGQACVPGVRCFADRAEAESFAKRMRDEPGHTCVDHVRIEESDAPIANDGYIYPAVANLGR